MIALWRMTGLDWRGIWSEIRHVDPRLYALALAVYFTTLLPRAARWQRMLRNLGHDVPLRALGEAIFLSWFISHLIPAKMGDLYRGFILRRREGISFALTTGSVLAERVVDLFAVLLLAAAAALFFARGELLNEMQGALLSAGVLAALLAGGLLFFRRLDGSLLARLPLLRRRRQKLEARFQNFKRGVFTSARPLHVMVLLTALVWTAEAGRFYLVANAVGVPLALPQLLFVFAASALLLAVPTPGGLGAVEGGMVGLMLLLDVPVDVAAAVALLDRLISYWLVLLGGGVYYFTHARLRL